MIGGERDAATPATLTVTYLHFLRCEAASVEESNPVVQKRAAVGPLCIRGVGSCRVCRRGRCRQAEDCPVGRQTSRDGAAQGQGSDGELLGHVVPDLQSRDAAVAEVL